MKRLKIGDNILVITGAEKGKTGKILKFVAKDRAIVEGLDIHRRHYPSSPTRDAGISTVNCSIHASNLMLIIDNKPTKVKVIMQNNKRTRISRKEVV